MEVVTVVILLALLLLGVLYSWRYVMEYWQYRKKVSKLPMCGLKEHILLRHAWWGMVPRGKLLENCKLAIDSSPPFFRLDLGPLAVLALYRARHLEVLFSSPVCIAKPFPYTIFLSPWLGTGLLTSSGSKWHYRRKLLTPAFHFTILENFIEVFADNSQVLVKKLEKEIGSESFDVFPYIAMCALDIICETTMGVKINAQENGKQVEYVNAVFQNTDQVMERLVTPYFHLDFIYNLFPSGRRFKKNITTLHNFTLQVIRDRKKSRRNRKEDTPDEDIILGKKKRMAFLDLLLESSENGDFLTDEDIREEVDTFMFEGHDTTTAAVSWALHLLGKHLDIQEKVHEEIDSLFQGSDRVPTMKDLNELKYLERVIKESLRLYPSVPLIGRAPEQDIEIEGVTIPAGIPIGVVIYFTHRDPEHYPDPLTFNPDNFLPERVANRHPYAYIPFSAGYRNCIGQKFAMLEEKMMLTYILRNYRVVATIDDPIPRPEVILRPEKGICLQIMKRIS